MPYLTNAELPHRVRNVLPPHAQDVYREAFNHAWVEYGQDDSRAHRVAWSAVKRHYIKEDGEWVPSDLYHGKPSGVP
jgi:cation transport regulator